ncbi:hypothetical protein B0J18DRAFT_201635 [Chaetomium sp. MPI-SDFR-AT-0129]|nr:hypothetical protein B0J18DRAFT_201635 [Chaetomium sp. MPI-SDFR-AT-0129]
MALESCRRSGQHQDARPVFLKEGKTLTILRPSLEFEIARANLEMATTGFIASVSRPEVKTAATSGWLPNERRGPHVLDTVKYLRLVGSLARVLGVELEASFRDTNGKSLLEHNGRFTASHSEKKLATFWVIAALHANVQTTDLTRVAELGDIRLPLAWREAIIYLDHSPCHNLRTVLGVSGCHKANDGDLDLRRGM